MWDLGYAAPIAATFKEEESTVCIAGTQNFPPLLRNCRNGTTRRRYIESFLFSPPRRPPKVPRSPKTKPTVSFLSIIPIYQQLSLKAVIKTVVPLLQLSCSIGGEFRFSKSSLDLKIDPLTNFNCER